MMTGLQRSKAFIKLEKLRQEQRDYYTEYGQFNKKLTERIRLLTIKLNYKSI